MFPDILSENMGNDIAKVHQNPLRSPPAFDAQRFGARTGEDTADMVRDGTRLAVRIRRTYNQVVGNRGQWGYLRMRASVAFLSRMARAMARAVDLAVRTIALLLVEMMSKYIRFH
jgi:hypothetical protein